MTRLRSRIRSARRTDDRGAVAVEFALVVIPLIVLVLGITQLGFAYNTQESLTQSARSGARQAAVCGATCGSVSAIAATVANNSPNLDSSQVAVNVSYCPAGGGCGGSPSYCPTGATQATGSERVSISYPYSFLAAVTGNALTITITGTASMPCGG